MMHIISFKYEQHPGDLLRNTDVIQLPNPDDHPEEFLISFLNNYQSDNRVAYLDDLFKLVHNEFITEVEKQAFVKIIGNKTEKEIKQELKSVEDELKNEAYKNFYSLICNHKIKIIIDAKKY
jgi:hypothetical protein